MDNDRPNAARKLPQTSANFFVGTNSRVPRMTLAQSSHIIPIPTALSPTSRQTSNVVLNRLQGSPFLSSPTSAKSITFPRSAFSEGGKAAKAAQFFSSLTDIAESASHDLARTSQGPSQPDRGIVRPWIADKGPSPVPIRARVSSDVLPAAGSVDHRRFEPNAKRSLGSTSAPETPSQPFIPERQRAISQPHVPKPGPFLASSTLPRVTAEKAIDGVVQLPLGGPRASPTSLTSDWSGYFGTGRAQIASKAPPLQERDYDVASIGAESRPTLAPESAFSDATAPSVSPDVQTFAVQQAGLDLHQQGNTVIDKRIPSPDDPSSSSLPSATMPLRGSTSPIHLPPSTPPARTPTPLGAAHGIDGPIDSVLKAWTDTLVLADKPLEESLPTSSSAAFAGDTSSASIQRLPEEVGDEHDIDPEQTRENESREEGEASGFMGMAASGDMDRIQPSSHDQEAEIGPEAVSEESQSHDLEDGAEVALGVSGTSNSARAQLDWPLPDSGELRRDTASGLPFLTEDAVLYDLIDEIAKPEAGLERTIPHNSRLDRTASWIQSTSTFAEEDAGAATLPGGDHDHLDNLSVAYGITSESADLNERSDTPPVILPTSPSSAVHDQTYVHLKDAVLSTPEVQPRRSSGLAQPLDLPVTTAVDAKQDRDNRVDGRSSRPPSRPHGSKIGRSYSQRERSNTVAGQRARHIPGRLKIPGLKSETVKRQHRQSLELLHQRRARHANANEVISPEYATVRSPREATTERSSNFNDMLGLWAKSLGTGPEGSAAQAPSPQRQRVGQAIRDWDEVGSDEDAETASVTVGKRMVLRRLSDLAIHPTPHRQARPLPGKLPRGSYNSDEQQEPKGLIRPLRRFRPEQTSDTDGQSTRPLHRQGKPHEPKKSAHHNQPDLFPSDSTNTVEREPVRLPPRAMVLEDHIASIKNGRPVKVSAVSQPQKWSTSRTNATSEQEPRPIAANHRNLSADSLSTSVGAGSLKPLRLQSTRSSPGTSRGPDTSATTTSPFTVASEAWTPNTSQPAISAEANATRIDTTAGSRLRSPVPDLFDIQSSAGAIGNHTVERATPRLSSRPSTRDQHRSSSRANSHSLDEIAATERSPSRNLPASQARPGVYLSPYTRSLGSHPPSSPRSSQNGAHRESVTPAHSADMPMPGFEISFSLQEPKMAPHVQAGTLLELGFRVHIKPTGGNHSERPWRLVPPSPSRADPIQRRTPHVNPEQFEYSHLTTTQLAKVQAEAQEHLLRNIDLSEPRGQRSARGSSPLSTPSKERLEPRRSPSLATETLDAPSPSRSTRGPYREMLLPKSRQPSISRSTTESSILTPAELASPLPKRSSGTASPLPYIKRAPPRKGTVSTVISHP
ncbi:hypothetical protein PSEUBRA_004858 [Kalmanozyma brasiliensis GHG001]|uniref:uncharacterized protein n=1 Tax=Kalmanozyma brasiliensis (strain GHG001) TaxID=1365824 RepID=UPI002868192F|nr:uncharacterized protein PSEUBRA_004858 [Kalmanozyma brasiliensis GHG001]KAF6767442.1 hypothetical protein PSEUBRA_004858 [Kalmanozyma brasiliensis GHG001]